MSARSRWARYRALPRTERALAREAWAAILAARARLAARGFEHALAWSRRARPPRGDGAAAPAVERAVERAARLLPGSKCLPQALAAAVLLRRRGLAPELRLGAARRDPSLRWPPIVAHAWLELDGRVVFGDPETSRFRVFEPLPRGRPEE